AAYAANDLRHVSAIAPQALRAPNNFPQPNKSYRCGSTTEFSSVKWTVAGPYLVQFRCPNACQHDEITNGR
ncbi:hypothetical protein Ciccas_011483, partial [Cichlidogyrus casuarinus]